MPGSWSAPTCRGGASSRSLLVAPLAIPAFVSSYGWASAIPSIQGLGGGLLVATLAYYPLVYLPALATLRGLDPALEESARSLGLGSWAVFGRVILPQLRLAILGGGLIVALHLLAEYGAFAFIRFDTFTTAIVVAYQSTFAGPSAAALGVVLASLCLVLLVIEAAARGRRRYARVGSGSPQPAERTRLGRATPLALAALVVLGVAATVVPLVSVVRWLAASDAGALGEIPGALVQTMLLAGGGAIGAILVALPVAWLSGRYPGRTEQGARGSVLRREQPARDHRRARPRHRDAAAGAGALPDPGDRDRGVRHRPPATGARVAARRHRAGARVASRRRPARSARRPSSRASR